MRSSSDGSAGKADELEAIVDELLVDLVAEDDDLRVFGDDIGQGLELIRRIGDAAGIAGGVDQEAPWCAGQCALELVRGDLEGIGFLAADDFGVPPASLICSG